MDIDSLCSYADHSAQCDNRWTLNFGRKLCSYHNAVLNGRAQPGPAPRKVAYMNWWLARQVLNAYGENKARTLLAERVVNYLLVHPTAGGEDAGHLEVRYGIQAKVSLDG
jgi:hypothetical protein